MQSKTTTKKAAAAIRKIMLAAKELAEIEKRSKRQAKRQEATNDR